LEVGLGLIQTVGELCHQLVYNVMLSLLVLFSGELELENVPLKKNIFRSWGFPIEVKSGVVGRIKIEFNLLKYFRNEPVLISIENIYLVAGPLNLAEVSRT